MDTSLGGAIDDLVQLKRRLAGSAAERDAIALVARRLEEAGENPVLEGFVEVTSAPLNFALHLLVAAGGAAVGWRLPLIGLALVVLALGSAVLQLRGRGRGLRMLIPRGASYNVVVRRPATKRRLGTLVVTAHVDVRRRGFRLTSRLIWPGLIAALVLAVALLGRALGVAPGLLPWVEVLAGLVLGAGVIVALLHHRTPTRKGPGAGDTGVAALEELSAALQERPLRHLELALVVTGCGEAHAGGLRALLEQHRHEWAQEDTYVVVLESLEQGRLVYGTGEQLLDRVTYRHTLPALAERVARQPAWRHVRSLFIDGFTGGLVPTLNGMRALVLTSEKEPDAGIESPEAGVREAAAFGAELIWALDSDLSELAR